MKLGIYIHWPYCLSKCPYCDFFSQVKKDVPQEEIIQTYLEDLDFYYDMTTSHEVVSIFFGGGTPSLIAPQNIEKIINHIHKKWNCMSSVEVSLEANPNTAQPNLFGNLKSAGINRLSLGVQALNDADLKFLGRTHDLAEAKKAINQVLKNFDNHSMDLIYARPNQELCVWEQELKEAVSFGFKHLSLYQLTIEEGTVFYKKGMAALDEDKAVSQYLATEQILGDYGYHKYEVSNYAQSGFESVHNKLYWQGEDYLGIGKSAHGRIGNLATVHPRQIEKLTTEERSEEKLLMGLRLVEGVNLKSIESILNQEMVKKFVDQGLLEQNKTRLKATSDGFLVLNYLIENLVKN